MKDDVTKNIEFISDQFGLDYKYLPRNMFPLKFKIIPKYQEEDKNLMKKLFKKDTYKLTAFHGGENKEIDLITKDEKIVIPESI